MKFIILGLIGIGVAWFISKTMYDYAVAARRIKKGAPFSGAVPGWVSLLFLVSLGSIIYGVILIL